MPDKLTLKAITEEKVLTVFGTGRLTYASAVAFKSQLKLWLASDVTAIIFDMKEITQIDSAGLGLLAQTLNQAATRGLKFRVENPAASIAKIFELSGLTYLLKKHLAQEP